jgi:hypothetical protein
MNPVEGNFGGVPFCMNEHPILFLNGTSSSGKTTTARALQRLWHEPMLYASIDSFIFMFADHVLKNDEVRKRALWPLISAFNQSLPNLAETGFPVVVDYVMVAAMAGRVFADARPVQGLLCRREVPARRAGKAGDCARRPPKGIRHVAVRSCPPVRSLRS